MPVTIRGSPGTRVRPPHLEHCLHRCSAAHRHFSCHAAGRKHRRVHGHHRCCHRARAERPTMNMRFGSEPKVAATTLIILRIDTASPLPHRTSSGRSCGSESFRPALTRLPASPVSCSAGRPACGCAIQRRRYLYYRAELSVAPPLHAATFGNYGDIKPEIAYSSEVPQHLPGSTALPRTSVGPFQATPNTMSQARELAF
jgi:hypothetical protein